MPLPKRLQPLQRAASQLLKISLLAITVSCSTAPTKFNEFESGSWDIRAMIRDKVKSKSYIINIDAIAVKPDRLRMEFSTPVGIALGAFALADKKVAYYTSENKKVQTAPANEAAMQPLIQTRIDPYLLIDVLFDETPREKGWECTKDNKGFMKSCKHVAKNIKLNWLKRELKQRAVEIETATTKIQLGLKGFKPKVEVGPETFQIITK